MCPRRYGRIPVLVGSMRFIRVTRREESAGCGLPSGPLTLPSPRREEVYGERVWGG
jgi:hypothetical protein